MSEKTCCLYEGKRATKGKGVKSRNLSKIWKEDVLLSPRMGKHLTDARRRMRIFISILISKCGFTLIGFRILYKDFRIMKELDKDKQI